MAFVGLILLGVRKMSEPNSTVIETKNLSKRFKDGSKVKVSRKHEALVFE